MRRNSLAVATAAVLMCTLVAPAPGWASDRVAAGGRVSALAWGPCPPPLIGPRDLATYRRNVARDRRAFPATAGFPANIWACAFWPARRIEPAVRVRGTGPEAS